MKPGLWRACAQPASGAVRLAKWVAALTIASMMLLRRFWQRLLTAYRGFLEHEDMLAAAGIAYYVALSFFPLLLVLVAGLGWVLAWTDAGQEAQQKLLEAIQQQASQNLADQVERSLNAVSTQAASSGPIGFAVLVISAIAIFAQLDAAFDRIFKVPSDPQEGWISWLGRLLFQRLKALAMLLGVGGFIVLVMVASMILSAVLQAMQPTVQIGPWIHWVTSFWTNLGLNMLALAVIYQTIPKPAICWWDALRGAIVAAILWEAGRQALAAYLLHLNYPSAYGVIGSFLAVMLWAYYAALVVLFGAEYVRTLGEERTEQRELPPKS